MSGAGTCAPTDSVVAFDNCMEIVADHSIQELTTDASRCAPATAPKTPAPCPADSDGGGGGGNRGWCRTAWGGVHRVLSSSVGLVLLLIIYTVVGAAVLHHTESKREQQLHAQLDDIRRRVVADIINVTSRDRVTSRDPSDEAATADAVEARLVEYSDARVSLRPNLKPTWTFAGALYFCGTVYTTIGQFRLQRTSHFTVVGEYDSYNLKSHRRCNNMSYINLPGYVGHSTIIFVECSLLRAVY